jgi:hypothetical protein
VMDAFVDVKKDDSHVEPERLARSGCSGVVRGQLRGELSLMRVFGNSNSN